MDIYTVLFIYLEAVNLLTLGVFGVDKHRARVHRERVPEALLMAMVAVGGGVGALAGMLLFHHKTRKKLFSVGVPAILVCQIGFFLCLFWAVSH